MEYPLKVRHELKRNEIRRKVIDVSFTTVLLLSMVAGIWWGLVSKALGGYDGTVIRILLVLLIVNIQISIFKHVQLKIENAWAPSYIIDDSDPDVVRLFGSVAVDGKDGAANRLLRTRPDLELYSGDTYKKYGSTLAAIALTPERKKAIQELEEKGIALE